MAAECEFVLRSGDACSVPAFGRCFTCERAFCRSHGKGGECLGCLAKHPVQKQPVQWANRFEPVEYFEGLSSDEENRVAHLLIMAVNRITIHTISLGAICIQLELDGSLGDVHRARLAWAVLQELVLVGWYTSDDETQDRLVWESPYESAVREQYENFGIHKFTIPSTFSPQGLAYEDSRFFSGLMTVLRSRRPSKNLVEAWQQFLAPVQRAEKDFAALPVAGHDDLVRYLRTGAHLEPDDWSRSNGVRLQAVPWPALAKALLEAGISPSRRSIRREVTGIFGRPRFIYLDGWTLPVAGSPTTRSLAIDGTLMDRYGVIEKNPGKASPSSFSYFARTHVRR